MELKNWKMRTRREYIEGGGGMQRREM